MTFRDPRLIERYEYVAFELENPIANVGAGATQAKTGYIISVNGSNEPSPFDWYKGFIEVTFKLSKLDNTAYAAGDDTTLINGSYSLISRLGLDIEGIDVPMTDNINQCVSLKNILHFSSEYSDSTAEDKFYFLDKNTLGQLKGTTLMQLTTQVFMIDKSSQQLTIQ